MTRKKSKSKPTEPKTKKKRSLQTSKSADTLTTSRVDGKKALTASTLDRFKNRTRHRDYTIDFDCPEFTCICPVSGFPDFAHIHISYVPENWCVELKSLKLYFNQFRDRGIFHEDVVNVILDDLLSLLKPKKMEVVGDFNVRGNIKTVIRAEFSKKNKAK